MPICDALRDTENLNDSIKIDVRDLPHKDGDLLRPAVVWFGENLDRSTLSSAHKAVNEAELLLVVGTSSVVYPAASFAQTAKSRGVPVYEFNLEATTESDDCFVGKAGDTLPRALGLEEEVSEVVSKRGEFGE
eukprot:GHVN01103060.1.p2 GENE.GHVN01103060.1~~GHVN01103060.1.p2  ORF type:complete len:133 (-),score=40.59 GHVN01103060.1:115-513(-)